MDLEYLKRTARQFAYQLRKFFPSDESPINHYVCEQHVVVLSTKKLYVYYYENWIDYVGDFLAQCEVIEKNEELKLFKVNIKGKSFDLQFENNKDYSSFLKYFEKYSD